MAMLRKFFNQTRKPEGILGKMMLSSMNAGHAKLAEWGLSQLPAGTVEKAVDLGCGAGGNVGELLRKYKDAHVTGVDYSDLSVEKSKQCNRKAIEAGRCDIQSGNVADLKLPAATYDLATAFETVYFWPGLEKCFTQAARVLKPGGFFLICNESDGRDAAGLKFETIIDGMKTYTAEEIENALKAAGFSAVKSEHHPSRPWIMVLARK